MAIQAPELPIIDHCPDCFADPTWFHGFYGHSTLACPNCYDGAPDAGPNLEGFGRNDAETIEAWNEAVSERILDASDDSICVVCEQVLPCKHGTSKGEWKL